MLSRFLSQRLLASSQVSFQRVSQVAATQYLATRGFAAKSNINEDQIESELKYQRENPDKALYHDKQNAKQQVDYKQTDGQHAQYRSMTSVGSGAPDPSEQERLKIMHQGERDTTKNMYEKSGTSFSSSQVRNFDSEAYRGDNYQAKEYQGVGDKTNPADYKTYTKEEYQNLNARNVGNPTPAQDGKYEQKTGQFGMYNQDASMPEGARVHSYLNDNWKKDIQEGSGQHDTRTFENTREHDQSVQNPGQRQDYSKKVIPLEQQRANENLEKPKQFGGKEGDTNYPGKV